MNMLFSLFYHYATQAVLRFRALAVLRFRVLAALRFRTLKREQLGQGTTEYAILVGVLVLMAIVAVVAFRGRLQELWTAITDGINSL